MRFGIIYCIRNMENGKRYVGKTIRTVARRWAIHQRWKGKPSTALQRAIAKYGSGRFDVSVLEKLVRLRSLDAAEKKWIKKLNSKVPNGYNLTDGGDGGSDHPVVREKQRQAALKQWKKQSRSDRAAFTRALWKTPEHRAKVSAAQKAASKRMSAAAKEHWRDPACRDRMIKSQRGANNASLRAKRSKDQKNNWRNPEYRKRMTDIQRSRPPVGRAFREKMRRVVTGLWKTEAYRAAHHC